MFDFILKQQHCFSDVDEVRDAQKEEKHQRLCFE